jgi:hypothetical protein
MAGRRLLLQGGVHRALPPDPTGLRMSRALGAVPDDAPMRVLVVGAGGFIGSRIVGRIAVTPPRGRRTRGRKRATSSRGRLPTAIPIPAIAPTLRS